MRFRVNSPQVISETIQGETIIINLTTGTYYSLQGSGAAIWEGIAASATADEIVDRLETVFDASRDELTPAVSSLLGELETEQLVVRTENGGPRPDEPAVAASEGKATFVAPSLAKYTDMQDLVLLDPVHEVTEAGWPEQASAEVSGG